MPIFVLGMIKPSLVRAKSRGRAALFSFYFFIASFILFAISLPSKPKTEENAAAKTAITETATLPEYKVFKTSDRSMPTRKRLQIFIIADGAKTKEERVAVVMHAARQIQIESGASVVRVALEASEKVAGGGSAFALATYIPDGCGQSGSPCDGKVWAVDAADTQVNEHEMAVWEAWIDNRNKFIEDDALNEEKLQEFLAVQFKTDPEKITIPFIWREPVDI